MSCSLPAIFTTASSSRRHQQGRPRGAGRVSFVALMRRANARSTREKATRVVVVGGGDEMASRRARSTQEKKRRNCKVICSN